ncbi:hypothetical protein FHS31_003025 [Sphingomonas vulcanisoli]|uniref:Uncharacterized protein n=1 Tax=Sphingomonas vulcanisoli TaxID=1658060 RepID=A0ABX0TWH4_9SPHN|nr:hypothetical protein [Sphingomonas vulcanisoli]NIJ09393.1 hypothetical protein [Sphingomonas vulcanisoli]
MTASWQLASNEEIEVPHDPNQDELSSQVHSLERALAALDALVTRVEPVAARHVSIASCHLQHGLDILREVPLAGSGLSLRA